MLGGAASANWEVLRVYLGIYMFTEELLRNYLDNLGITWDLLRLPWNYLGFT